MTTIRLPCHLVEVDAPFVDPNQNDSSFIPWTELVFSENAIHGKRHTDKANSTHGLCDGGIGQQMNADLGSFYRRSTGVDGYAIKSIFLFALFCLTLPIIGISSLGSIAAFMATGEKGELPDNEKNNTGSFALSFLCYYLFSSWLLQFFGYKTHLMMIGVAKTTKRK